MNIAIQGHPTRGKEVIQILKSLGGINTYSLSGTCLTSFYYINKNNNIKDAGKSLSDYTLYTLEEFEKEFPFKIGDKVTIVGLPDFPKVITQMVWDRDEILYSFESLNNTWFGAKSLKKFEMKEERNITLTLDKAKEWYQKGGELKEVALQAYSKEELIKIELPKTWEEFCKNYPIKAGESWIGAQGFINVCKTDLDSRQSRNWIPSKKSAEAHLALIQLEQLRDCYRQGDIPDFTNDSKKYCITKTKNDIHIVNVYDINHFLSFTKKEVVEEFLINFKPLIKIAENHI